MSKRLTLEDLYRMWVSTSVPFPMGTDSFARIRESIRREISANRRFPNRASEGCKREARGHAVLLGKLIKERARTQQV